VISKWYQRGIKVKSKWDQSEIKVGPTWDQRTIKVRLKWDWSATEVTSTWHRSDVEVRCPPPNTNNKTIQFELVLSVLSFDVLVLRNFAKTLEAICVHSPVIWAVLFSYFLNAFIWGGLIVATLTPALVKGGVGAADADSTSVGSGGFVWSGDEVKQNDLF
jgi:hypothetical protein